MEHSKIDDLFNELFGFYPKKPGQAYELLVAAALKVITQGKVSFNQFKKGEYSDTTYQLDAIVEEKQILSMVESKDYTIKDKKVGRGDLQKLQGALTDLNINKGIFASATEFTAPSKKYAEATERNPLHKNIELFHIRPATILDDKGRIKEFIITIIISTPQHTIGEFDLVFKQSAIDQFKKEGISKVQTQVGEFYNADGSLNTTVEDFTYNNQPVSNDLEADWAEGCWILNGLYIKYNFKLYGILGMKYKIPYQKMSTTFSIKSEGTTKVLVKSEDGKINKVLTDEQFKKITFEDNEVV